jgi:hypothetical protein
MKFKIKNWIFKVVFFILLIQSVAVPTIGQSKPKYTWNGKSIAYKAWRDSLNVEYLKYCDSLRRTSKKARK